MEVADVEVAADVELVADIAEMFGSWLRICEYGFCDIKDVYTSHSHKEFVADKFEDIMINIDNLASTFILFQEVLHVGKELWTGIYSQYLHRRLTKLNKAAGCTSRILHCKETKIPF